MKSRDVIELALGTVETEAITPELVASVIDDVARHEVVLCNLFKPLRDFMNVQGRRVEVPRYRNFVTVISDVSEGTSIPPSSFSYDALTVDVAKFGIRVEITNEALESPYRDLLKDALELSGKEWATELEKRAYTITLDLHLGSITSWSGGTLGSTSLTPIVSIVSTPAGVTVDSVDYYDGKVLLSNSIESGTLTFLYSARCSTLGTSLVRDASNKGTLTSTDILALRDTMLLNTIDPDVMLIHKSDINSLLQDTVFAEYFTPYSEIEKPEGKMLGEFLGIKVMAPDLHPRGHAVLVDSSRLGYDVVKRKLEGTREDKPEYDSVWYHMWSERELAVSDTLSVGLITNLKTGSYKASDL